MTKITKKRGMIMTALTVTMMALTIFVMNPIEVSALPEEVPFTNDDSEVIQNLTQWNKDQDREDFFIWNDIQNIWTSIQGHTHSNTIEQYWETSSTIPAIGKFEHITWCQVDSDVIAGGFNQSFNPPYHPIAESYPVSTTTMEGDKLEGWKVVGFSDGSFSSIIKVWSSCVSN